MYSHLKKEFRGRGMPGIPGMPQMDEAQFKKFFDEWKAKHPEIETQGEAGRRREVAGHQGPRGEGSRRQGAGDEIARRQDSRSEDAARRGLTARRPRRSSHPRSRRRRRLVRSRMRPCAKAPRSDSAAGAAAGREEVRQEVIAFGPLTNEPEA